MKQSDWFKVWFRAMPLTWQEGFINAMQERTIFRGELLAMTKAGKDMCVWIMPRDVADDIEQFLARS